MDNTISINEVERMLIRLSTFLIQNIDNLHIPMSAIISELQDIDRLPPDKVIKSSFSILPLNIATEWFNNRLVVLNKIVENEK